LFSAIFRTVSISARAPLGLCRVRPSSCRFTACLFLPMSIPIVVIVRLLALPSWNGSLCLECALHWAYALSPEGLLLDPKRRATRLGSALPNDGDAVGRLDGHLRLD